MKKIAVIVIVLGAAVGAYFLFFRGGEHKEDANGERTVRIERGTIRTVVSSTGRVVANLDVEIKCKASGEVVRLPFDVSDVVKKGDLLLELDPVDETRSVRRAETALGASKARLVQAQKNLDIAVRGLATAKQRARASLRGAEARAKDARTKAERMRQLLAKRLCSQEDCDTAETAAVQAAADLEGAKIRIEELATEEMALELRHQDVRLAEAQVELDRIAVENARQRLADTKVVAPIDGIVADRQVQIGQIISSGISNVGGGTTVLTLSDLSRLYVLASVDESDVGQVEVDMPVEITADAFQGTSFRGKVVRIAARGKDVSNVVTFEVKIEVLGKEKTRLKPGMTANVKVVAASKENVLLVPTEAVMTDGELQVVLVKNGENPPEERPVRLGLSNGVHAEVTGGLKEGETVIVRPDDAESRWRRTRRRSGNATAQILRNMRRRRR